MEGSAGREGRRTPPVLGGSEGGEWGNSAYSWWDNIKPLQVYTRCECTDGLRSKLDYLSTELNDSSSVKRIDRRSFEFARDKDQRNVDMDMAKCMLTLLLGRTCTLFPVFLQFLELSKYKAVNKDQGYQMLEFSRTICTNLTNYDEDGASGLTVVVQTVTHTQLSHPVSGPSQADAATPRRADDKNAPPLGRLH
ncbi:LOW QUALITY PROTEIN: DCN1-like protein 5 [Phycodurus eques]|uniref:LOW QUALITY PROTEIN: DCN1-like protein 5 n=1 Tax=Phycodurus eques TaxID=693459 RepID=UPI002ACE369E|nr:LOW QUALITY PROTEIN: DCN1-like protein 5 [Phycodurus eques]